MEINKDIYTVIKVPFFGLKGKTVQGRHGPAAVSGDEIHPKTTVFLKEKREGVENRMIRESEDLPL
jgi:hypothetical protein